MNKQKIGNYHIRKKTGKMQKRKIIEKRERTEKTRKERNSNDTKRNEEDGSQTN